MAFQGGAFRKVGFEVGEDGNFVLTCMGDRGFMLIPGGSFEVTGGNEVTGTTTTELGTSTKEDV